MNINSTITDQDSGKPAEFVNSTYEALKYNPQATQQVLQRGTNAGLAGLGAMAASRFQTRAQDMQQTQQATQAGQQPQPTVLQQLQMAAMQGGIMGQLPTNIQMAQQGGQAPQGGAGLADIPVDPNALPQQMAGGGLVALAQGGYLDADGSVGYEPVGESYAHGGEVRGFEFGGSANAYDPTQGPWDYMKDATSRLSNALLPGYEDYRNKIEEIYDADVDDEDAESLAEKQREYYETTSAPPSLRRQLDAKPQPEQPANGGRNGEVPEAQKSVRNPKAAPPKEATKTDKAFKKSQIDDNHLATRTVSSAQPQQNAEPRGVTPTSLRAQYDEAATLYGSGSPEAQALREQILTAERNIQEAQPQGQTVPSSGGLPAIQAQRQERAIPEEDATMAMIDKIKAARGMPSAMSPEERAWRQEQIESSKTDKWLQTLTAMAAGTFGGNGRTWPQAIGQGALYGLSTYRQGAQAEAEAELGLLNAESKAKEEARKAQEEAADKYFGILSEQGKLGSAERNAVAKVISDREREQYRAEARATEGALNRENRTANAQIMAGGRAEKDFVTQQAQITDMVNKELQMIKDTKGFVTPEDQAQAIQKVYNTLRLPPPGLGGGQTLAGGQGMGTRPIVLRSGIIPAGSSS